MFLWRDEIMELIVKDKFPCGLAFHSFCLPNPKPTSFFGLSLLLLIISFDLSLFLQLYDCQHRLWI